MLMKMTAFWPKKGKSNVQLKARISEMPIVLGLNSRESIDSKRNRWKKKRLSREDIHKEAVRMITV